MKTLVERFLDKVTKTDGCWNWDACKNDGGYGRIQTTDGLKLAHRLSWTLFVGEIPDGHDVLHRCDNPSCVNPEHLFTGTAADNMRDMASKGRHRSKSKPNSVAKGSNHYRFKITPEIVSHIRSNSGGYGSQRRLALIHGLSEAAVSLIVRGKGKYALPNT
jgi:hypothetical protein